jgi:addiction module RelE/StbE family toxin
MEIIYSPLFIRQYKKLPISIKLKAEKCELWFKNDPFDSRLKTHKLSGRLVEYYALSVTHSYRIIFRFLKENTIARFYQIGTHDIYD